MCADMKDFDPKTVYSMPMGGQAQQMDARAGGPHWIWHKFNMNNISFLYFFSFFSFSRFHPTLPLQFVLCIFSLGCLFAFNLRAVS